MGDEGILIDADIAGYLDNLVGCGVQTQRLLAAMDDVADDVGRAVPDDALIAGDLFPAEHGHCRRAEFKAAIIQQHAVGGWFFGVDMGYLAIRRTECLPDDVAVSGIALEAGQVLVVDVVEDGCPWIIDLAVAVVLEADEVVEDLVGFFDADHGIGDVLSHGLVWT